MVPLAYEIIANKIVHIHLKLPFFIFIWPRKWSIFIFSAKFYSKSIYPKIKLFVLN